MLDLNLIKVPTPVGKFYMILEGETVIASGFGTLEALEERLSESIGKLNLTDLGSKHPYYKHVKAYFAGDMEALNGIEAKQSGTDFYHKVWAAISEVKPGKTIYYKDLAKKSGHELAVRAIGSVCGKNNLILLVPCHRIIKADGTFGNYYYGPKIREFLLAHEKKNSKK